MPFCTLKTDIWMSEITHAVHSLASGAVTSVRTERAFEFTAIAGAICVLTKPFDGETLELCLAAALKGNGKSA